MAELVTICDPAGRARGSGFVADDRGTVVTSHEAVDGLTRVVVRAPGPAGRTWLAEAADVTALPGLALALVRTDGLGMRPLPVALREAIDPGTYVRLPARGWRQARVLGGAEVSYSAVDRSHAVPGGVAVELAIGTDGRDALLLGGEACGGPVLDAGTGAVLAVVGTALRSEHRSGGFAVALRAAADVDPDGPLAALLERNAATVPGHGADLNLAGALELTATTLGAPVPRDEPEPVERPGIAAELAAFTTGDRPVLGLVGDPGTGRTTALAALAVRRAQGVCPAPTLWLRGADLRATDTSLADAATRALTEAARIVAAAGSLRGGADPRTGSDGAGSVPGRTPLGAERAAAAPPTPHHVRCPRRRPGACPTPPEPPRSSGAANRWPTVTEPHRPGVAASRCRLPAEPDRARGAANRYPAPAERPRSSGPAIRRRARAEPAPAEPPPPGGAAHPHREPVAPAPPGKPLPRREPQRTLRTSSPAPAAACSSCSTPRRRCRRSSPTGSAPGPPPPPRGCTRPGPGSSSPPGPSTGKGPAPSTRPGRSTPRPGPPGGCRRPSRSRTSTPPRPRPPGPASASPRTPSGKPTPGTRSPCTCSPGSGPPRSPPDAPAATRSSPRTWTCCACAPPSALPRPVPTPEAPRCTGPGSSGSRPAWPAGSTRPRGASWDPGRGSWTGPRSRSCSPGAPAGLPPCSPRDCWCPPGPATASPTRSCPTGSRPATWTFQRPWACSSTAPPSPGRPCPGTASGPSWRPCAGSPPTGCAASSPGWSTGSTVSPRNRSGPIRTAPGGPPG